VAVKLLPDVGEAEQVLPLLAQEHLSTFLYIVFAGALVSAILSTVDSSLLAAASLVSHNLVVPLKPGITESAKVRLARIGVIVGGLTAYGLALSAENIYSLVEASSSFGGAGLFTIMVFGLFTRLGGRRSAFAALAASVAVWGWGTWVRELEHPFLWSMAAAFGAYGLFAMTLARPRKSQTEA
jgi:solute:Na+ symporter, SSS family